VPSVPKDGAAELGGQYIIAFANEKGGVGKTTSCVNVGAALAQRGLRVLCIDLDPQANLTAALGIPPVEAEAHGLHRFLSRTEMPLAEAVATTDVGNLELLPACPSLAEYEGTLAREPEGTGRLRAKLRRRLSQAGTGPDLVLLDCPPSLGVLTANALVAATHMIVPVTPRLYSLKSMAQLGTLVASLHWEAGATVKLLGILVTLFDENVGLDTTLYRLLKEKIEGEFGDFMFPKPIASSVAISEAEAGGRPVVVRAPKTSAALAYVALGEEVLARLRQDEAGALGSFVGTAAA